MKKMITLLACVALVGASTSAFAAFVSGDTNGNLAIGSTVKATLKLSANVKAQYTAHGTNPAQGYVLQAYHTSGSKTYGTSSGDTRLYFVDATGGLTVNAPAGGATADFSAWTAMQ